jgi:hypothetical protein
MVGSTDAGRPCPAFSSIFSSAFSLALMAACLERASSSQRRRILIVSSLRAAVSRLASRWRVSLTSSAT